MYMVSGYSQGGEGGQLSRGGGRVPQMKPWYLWNHSSYELETWLASYPGPLRGGASLARNRGQLGDFFRHTSEVKGHICGLINKQKYEFPEFTRCAHSVYQALSPPLKGPGYRARNLAWIFFHPPRKEFQAPPKIAVLCLSLVAHRSGQEACCSF